MKCKLMNTRVLVGVEVVEIVALFAEHHARTPVTELLHQKRVVPLHDLPYQGPGTVAISTTTVLHP